MLNEFSRTQLLLGQEAIEKLHASHVAIFGIGGVGGYVLEGLARSGIGTFTLVDDDKVCLTNINRQILATRETIGKYKTDVAKERVLSIYPEAQVHVKQTFFLPETAEEFDFTAYDYVVDAIDTVTGKIQLVLQAEKFGVPIISAMGAGNKMNPAAFQVADIYETSVDPLARVMRRELKKRGVKKLKVVYSTEKPLRPLESEVLSRQLNAEGSEDTARTNATRRDTPGSNAFVPPVAGLLIASEVVKDLIGYVNSF